MRIFKKVVIVAFFILTIVRFFTATVDLQREEDPTVIMKYVPTVQNVFYGSDKAASEYSEKYKWYRDGSFIELIHLGDTDLQTVYLAFSDLWYVSAVALAITGILTVVKK